MNSSDAPPGETRAAAGAGAPIGLDDPIRSVRGVGPALERRLVERLGIATVRALLEHYPRRYQDAGEVLDLGEVREGEPATLIGEVRGWSSRRLPARGRRRRPLHLDEAWVRQASGAEFRVTFFNQRWRPRQLEVGTVAAFSGLVKRFRRDLQLTGPDVQVLGRVVGGIDEEVARDRLAHQRLLPVYATVEGIASFQLNDLVAASLDALPEVSDWLPEALRRAHDLVDLDRAIRGIHQPQDHAEIARSHARLAFDELLTLQLGLQWRRAHLEAATVGLDNVPVADGWAARFLAALPFAPTAAQQRALVSIGADLAALRPMHRLLQGDVGAGKTLVAVWAMLSAVDHARQAALMVPTEVLAEQHARTLEELLAPLGVNLPDGLRLATLTSSTTGARRRQILEELRSGEVDLIVGTHALLEEQVRFADLGVVVIDEQHRFGVSQRVRLKDKADGGGRATAPDVLVMTATPIPRSLALTLYGDLDVTVLDELPPGRQPVVTQLITPDEAARRDRLYAFARAQVAEGARIYVVCPFVETSPVLAGTAAVDEHTRLTNDVFPDLEVALVHGRQRPQDKDAAMAAFRRGDAQVLVSTTVIEVGVDVPEATVMIIEDAERFGISQLHQLRGRVGRSQRPSYCVLFAGWSAPLGAESAERLAAVAATTDGFELAERDLALRGEGQLFGQQQSGLPDLRLARVQRDQQLVGLTRELARRIVADDPRFVAEGHAGLRAEVLRRYEGGLDAFAALETG